MQSEKPDNKPAATVETGRVTALLGALCVAHAAVWFLIRTPELTDPFVGAEGLFVGGLLLVAIGLGPLSERH